MARSARVLLPFLALFATLGAPIERAAVAADGQRVSVTVDSASLATVLARLARETGVAIAGSQTLQRTVSVRLTGMPLAVALTRLVAGIDHVLVEEHLADGEIRVVGMYLFGGAPPSGISVPSAVLSSDDDPTPDPTFEQAEHDMDVVERRSAALRLLGEAPQSSRSHEAALARVQRGLARQAEIDRLQQPAQR